jgi:hypothetical protein
MLGTEFAWACLPNCFFGIHILDKEDFPICSVLVVG